MTDQTAPVLSEEDREALGVILDRHVGWQMHRGAMVNDLAAEVARHRQQAVREALAEVADGCEALVASALGRSRGDYADGWRAASGLMLDEMREYAKVSEQHVAELEAAIDRVRRLHSQDDSLLEPGKWCPADGEEVPCPTIRALNGQSQRPGRFLGGGR